MAQVPVTPAGAATTSSPELFGARGRPDQGAAVARTEELYAQHRRLVSGLCSALLRDKAEAEDAAQQTFLAAHRALLNGTTPREPAAWLATIARNECWARIRSRMREPLATEDVGAESTFDADPLAQAIRRADLAALWRAIAELPRQQRDALLLREFAGLSYDELAGALSVTGPAVESLLFRARQGVRARLQTAYAAVSGAGWVDALLRLLAGASSSAAPVAAKVAVVGVGAAVATGGAVVAPQMFDHRSAAHPHKLAVHTTAAVSAPPPAIRIAAPAAPARLIAAHTVVRASSGDEHGTSGDGSDSIRSQGGSQDEKQASPGDRRSQKERDSGDGESRQAAGKAAPKHSPDSSEPSDSPGGGDAAPSAPADGGPPPPASGAGLTVPMTNPAVTVVAIAADEPRSGD